MIGSTFITIILSLFLASFNFNILAVNNDISGTIIEKQVTKHLPVRNLGVNDLELDAGAAAVLDVKDNIFLLEKNSESKFQIASISKLMTALVFLDNNPGWDTIYEIKRSDRRDGGKIYVYLGDKVKVKDLFSAMLVGSDNTATISLVSATGLSEEEFVKKMNAKAIELGLLNTSFAEPVGLSNDNVSTAKEIAELARVALSNPDIAKTVSSSRVEFTTESGTKKVIDSTDYLLTLFSAPNIRIMGGKTGHTDLAGYCFVAKFIDNSNHEIITVILNTKSDNERFRQTNKLINWVFDNFKW